MEKSRIATYAVGALLAIAAAVVYLATKNVELTAMLSTAASGVIGYAKQHVADKAPTPEKLGPPSNSTPVINGPGSAAALLLACSLLLSGQARAAEPQFGGSVLGGDLAFGPAATITVGRYQAGKFSAGVMPGACYEAVAWPDTWHSLGLSFCGQLSVGGSEANQGGVSGLLSFANWFRAGVGEVWTEQPAGPAKRDTALLFGFGTMLGGSPSYVASQGAR